MDALEENFAKLLGRQPSDTERQQLYRVKKALDLKDNDALWLVIMALQHYQTQYEKFPNAIEKAARDTLDHFKITADAVAAASSQKAKADMANAVAMVAKDVASEVSKKQMWQWATGCIAVSLICLGLVGWSMHESGKKTGYSMGYQEAKDERSAAAWANTPEGRMAYKLAKFGDLYRLAKCQSHGWEIKKGFCYPFSHIESDGNETVIGGRVE